MDRSSTKSERPKTRAGPATGNETGLIGNGHSHPCRHVPMGVKALDACCRPWRESGHVRRFPWPGRAERGDRQPAEGPSDRAGCDERGGCRRRLPSSAGQGWRRSRHGCEPAVAGIATRRMAEEATAPARASRCSLPQPSGDSESPVKAYGPKRLAARTDCERALSPGSGALGLRNEQ